MVLDDFDKTLQQVTAQRAWGRKRHFRKCVSWYGVFSFPWSIPPFPDKIIKGDWRGPYERASV